MVASGRVFSLLLVAQLAGCAYYEVRAGSGRSSREMGATTSVQISASSDSTLGVVVIVSLLLAEGIRYFRQWPDGTRTPVDAETAVKLRHAPPRISAQDCSRPVRPDGGNLLCR